MAFFKSDTAMTLVQEREVVLDEFERATADLAARAATRRSVVESRLSELETEAKILAQLQERLA